MFLDRYRPNGLEFASCEACNSGTKAADFVTGFMARLRLFHGDRKDPLFKEALARKGSLEQLAPGLQDELFSSANTSMVWVQGPGGVHQQVTRVEAKSPRLAKLLATFGGKLGMALYREHTGAPLPLGGLTFVQPFLNGGLNQEQADALLQMLPSHNTLRQGKIDAGNQFGYRYNTDGKTILAALAHIHHNLHFFVVATSEPLHYGPSVTPLTMATVAPAKLADVDAESLIPRGPQGNASGLRSPTGLILPGGPRWPGFPNMQ